MPERDCGPKPSPVLERAAYLRWLACKRYFDEDENLGEHEWKKEKEPDQDNEEDSGSSINDKSKYDNEEARNVYNRMKNEYMTNVGRWPYESYEEWLELYWIPYQNGESLNFE